jgi:predicted O-methyltransferase YrrM
MTTKSLDLSPALYQYIVNNSLRESELLQKNREETAQETMARMQISPDQGQFLALLVKLIGAKTALEIGTFTGYSALCIAPALAEGGKLYCLDLDDEEGKHWTGIATRYFKAAQIENRIELMLAPAKDSLFELEKTLCGHVDFIFIDADKESYQHYFEQGLKLLRTGGLMVVDNVLWSGRVADVDNHEIDTIALREFNQALHKDERIDLSMIAVADGLSLIMKR